MLNSYIEKIPKLVPELLILENKTEIILKKVARAIADAMVTEESIPTNEEIKMTYDFNRVVYLVDYKLRNVCARYCDVVIATSYGKRGGKTVRKINIYFKFRCEPEGESGYETHVTKIAKDELLDKMETTFGADMEREDLKEILLNKEVFKEVFDFLIEQIENRLNKMKEMLNDIKQIMENTEIGCKIAIDNI